jgi:hypothetical protein
MYLPQLPREVDGNARAGYLSSPCWFVKSLRAACLLTEPSWAVSKVSIGSGSPSRKGVDLKIPIGLRCLTHDAECCGGNPIAG